MNVLKCLHKDGEHDYLPDKEAGFENLTVQREGRTCHTKYIFTDEWKRRIKKRALCRWGRLWSTLFWRMNLSHIRSINVLSKQPRRQQYTQRRTGLLWLWLQLSISSLYIFSFLPSSYRLYQSLPFAKRKKKAFFCLIAWAHSLWAEMWHQCS